MQTDRRSHLQLAGAGAAEIACRVCFRYVTIDAEGIFRAGDYDDAFWAFRCPGCGGSFPVREDDVPLPRRRAS